MGGSRIYSVRVLQRRAPGRYQGQATELHSRAGAIYRRGAYVAVVLPMTCEAIAAPILRQTQEVSPRGPDRSFAVG